MPNWKTLFQDPKKARVAILCGLVALATLAAVAVYAVRAPRTGPEGAAPPEQSGAASPAPEQSAAPEESGQPSAPVGLVPALTIDQAREMALADAGVTEEEAEVSREALAQDNGIMVYEFRFRTQAAQYEYKLNANTGEVRSLVKEVLVPSGAQPTGPAMPAVSPAGGAVPQPAPSIPPVSSAAPSADVGMEGAKAAALADAGATAAQAVFTKAETDYENGQLVYDLEFHTGTHEYEYEIVAATGAVYSRSAEAFQAALPSAAPGGAYIGVDRAKAIALDHAGLAAAQVIFTQASMDREDGAAVYEIEFRQGRVEYEYKIDAASGRILDHEMDAD